MMRKLLGGWLWAGVCLASAWAEAGECRLEMTTGAAPQVAAEIAAQLSDRHAQIFTEGDEPLCEIWITKQWAASKQAAPAKSFAPIEYGLEPGSVVGVLQLARTCYDFREQEIPAGVYVLRYAVQPDFESHRDSHESRDFLLLISAELDKSPAPIADLDRLIELSCESIASMHPGFLPLVKPVKPEREDSLRPDDKSANGWLLLLHGKSAEGKAIPLEMILLAEQVGG